MEGEEIRARGKNVMILGGGDTSADCLGNAHREGCASVRVLTHGPKPPDHPGTLEWPDWPFILRTYPAHEEGGERAFSVAVTGFSGSNGRVEKMHAVQTERTTEGKTEPIPGTDFEIEADLVLLAIGFTGPVRDRFLQDLGLGYNERGAIPATERLRHQRARRLRRRRRQARRVPDRLGHRRGPQGREAGGRVPDGGEPATRIGNRHQGVVERLSFWRNRPFLPSSNT